MAEEVVFKRDVRVDQIGFVDELQKLFADPLKEAVKAKHAAGDRLEGDFFTGRIDAASKTTVNAAKWFKLFNDGKISRAQFLDAITVSTTDAKRVLGETEFDKVSTTIAGANRLTVARKKDVELGLVRAVQSLHQTIGAEPRLAA